MILSFLLGWRLQCYLTLYDCQNRKHYLVLLATHCPHNPYFQQWVSRLPCHSSVPWIPITLRHREVKVQCKAHWSHIPKLREWCWLVKYTIVHFWISPHLQKSRMPLFGVRTSYHLKELYGHACGRGSEGLSLRITQRPNIYSLYKIFFKIWMFSFFP